MRVVPCSFVQSVKLRTTDSKQVDLLILMDSLKHTEIDSSTMHVPTHNSAEFKIRSAKDSDLEAVNAVISRAIVTWDLPARVERLIQPIYRYDEHDLRHLTMLVAENASDGIVGVAAWEPANSCDTPRGQNGLLLHGIYVCPEFHHVGIGTGLVERALQDARRTGCAGLLSKANQNAQEFYRATGWRTLGVENPERDYPYSFWLDASEN